MFCNRKAIKKPVEEDSENAEEENLMTDAQKEEEAMLKHTFNFYMSNKGPAAQIERYELPMILDGKFTLFLS